MTRNLRHLPGRELGVDVLGQLLAFPGKPFDFFGYINCGVVLHEAQFFDLGLQFRDRLLEIEKN